MGGLLRAAAGAWYRSGTVTVRRTLQLHLLVSVEEMRSLDEEAEERGVTRSVVVRERIRRSAELGIVAPRAVPPLRGR